MKHIFNFLHVLYVCENKIQHIQANRKKKDSKHILNFLHVLYMSVKTKYNIYKQTQKNNNNNNGREHRQPE